MPLRIEMNRRQLFTRIAAMCTGAVVAPKVLSGLTFPTKAINPYRMIKNPCMEIFLIESVATPIQITFGAGRPTTDELRIKWDKLTSTT